MPLDVTGSDSLWWKTGIDTTGLSRGSTQSIGILTKMASKITALDVFAAIGIGAGLAFSKAASEAYKFSREFEASMLEVSTISRMVSADFEGMSQRIVDMSRIVPESALILSRALYQIVSAGYDTAQAFDILTESQKLAVAGVTDTFVAADAVTSAMNAYGEAVGTAANVADRLFTIVRLGKTTMRELGPEITTVTGLAANLGLNFNELSAFIAESVKTLKTPEAMTGIRGFITAIISPTEQAIEAAAKLGVQFDAAALRGKGLVQFMRDLIFAAKGNEKALSDLFPNVRGLTGLLSIAGDEGGKLAAVMREIEQSSGAVEVANRKMMQDIGKQTAILKNNIMADLKPLGDFILGMMGSIAGGLNRAMADMKMVTQLTIENGQDLLQVLADEKIGVNNLADEIAKLLKIVKPTAEQTAELTTLNEQLAIMLGTNLAVGANTAAEALRLLGLQKRFNIDTDREMLRIQLKIAEATLEQTRAERELFNLGEDASAKAMHDLQVRRNILREGVAGAVGMTPGEAMFRGAAMGFTTRAAPVGRLQVAAETAAQQALALQKQGVILTDELRDSLLEIATLKAKGLNTDALQAKLLKDILADWSAYREESAKITAAAAEHVKQQETLNLKVKAGEIALKGLQAARAGEKLPAEPELPPFVEIVAKTKAQIEAEEDAAKEAKRRAEDAAKAELRRQQELAKEIYDLTATTEEKKEALAAHFAELRLTALKTLADEELQAKISALVTLEAEQLQHLDYERDLDAKSYQYKTEWSVKELQDRLARLNELKSAYADNAAILYEIEQERARLTAQLHDKETAEYRKWLAGIDTVFKRQTKAQLAEQEKALRAALAKYPEQAEAILRLIAGIQEELFNRMRQQVQAITDALEGVGSALGDTDATLDKTIGMIREMVEIREKLTTAFAQEDWTAVMSGSLQEISLLVHFFQVLTSGTRESAYERAVGVIEHLDRTIARNTDTLRQSLGLEKIDKTLELYANYESKRAAALQALRDVIVLVPSAFGKTMEELGRLSDFFSDAELMEMTVTDIGERLHEIHTGVISITKDGAKIISDSQADITEAVNQMAQLKADWQEMMTATTASSIADAITQGFQEGKRSAEDFADDFESMMGDALIASFKNIILSKLIADWYEQFVAAASPGTRPGQGPALSAGEIAQLQTSFAALIVQAEEAWQGIVGIAEGAGVDLAQAQPSVIATGMVGAIAGITEETAGLLEGQIRGMRLDLRAMRAAVEAQGGDEMIPLLTALDARLTTLVRVAQETREYIAPYGAIGTRLLSILAVLQAIRDKPTPSATFTGTATDMTATVNRLSEIAANTYFLESLYAQAVPSRNALAEIRANSYYLPGVWQRLASDMPQVINRLSEIDANSYNLPLMLQELRLIRGQPSGVTTIVGGAFDFGPATDLLRAIDTRLTTLVSVMQTTREYVAPYGAPGFGSLDARMATGVGALQTIRESMAPYGLATVRLTEIKDAVREVREYVAPYGAPGFGSLDRRAASLVSIQQEARDYVYPLVGMGEQMRTLVSVSQRARDYVYPISAMDARVETLLSAAQSTRDYLAPTAAITAGLGAIEGFTQRTAVNTDRLAAIERSLASLDAKAGGAAPVAATTSPPSSYQFDWARLIGGA